jgi:DNA-binding PadR family transcriptional regulator
MYRSSIRVPTRHEPIDDHHPRGTELTMLELAVLGLLKERAMHGYELRKQLTTRLGLFWTVSFGSLYPTLRKMERHGLVQKVRPPEPGSRRRQIYRITDTGEHRFLDLLEERAGTAEEDKFPLRLAFFRYLRPETRIRLLERRKAYLEDRLAEGQRRLSRVTGASDTYTLSLMRHGVEITERDIAWLDELIVAERGVWEDSPSPRPRSEAPATAEVESLNSAGGAGVGDQEPEHQPEEGTEITTKA